MPTIQMLLRLTIDEGDGGDDELYQYLLDAASHRQQNNVLKVGAYLAFGLPIPSALQDTAQKLNVWASSNSLATSNSTAAAAAQVVVQQAPADNSALFYIGDQVARLVEVVGGLAVSAAGQPPGGTARQSENQRPLTPTKVYHEPDQTESTGLDFNKPRRKTNKSEADVVTAPDPGSPPTITPMERIAILRESLNKFNEQNA